MRVFGMVVLMVIAAFSLLLAAGLGFCGMVVNGARFLVPFAVGAALIGGVCLFFFVRLIDKPRDDD